VLFLHPPHQRHKKIQIANEEEKVKTMREEEKGEGKWEVDIVDTPLDLNECMESVSDDRAGAIASFVGVTRNTFNGKNVSKLEYECYTPMALKKLNELCAMAFTKWNGNDENKQINDGCSQHSKAATNAIQSSSCEDEEKMHDESETVRGKGVGDDNMSNKNQAHDGILKIAIKHRTGTVLVGEPSVIITVSSAHREASLDAVKWLIDELKATVPIWKKEFFEDGEVWKENSDQRLKPSQRGYAKVST
jgi:molybdopterin synthase catalytic subunit